MLEEGGNHQPVPFVECPRSVEGPIPIILYDTSNNH